jgi:hypothetical protein
MKIVINTCYGFFSLSDEAVRLYAQLVGLVLVEAQSDYCGTEFYRDHISEETYFSYYDIARDCPHLVQVIETLGTAANGDCAELKVVEVPDGVEWHIEEYDGDEWVAENHRTWS